MSEMMPGETFDEFWERTSYSAQLEREEKAEKRRKKQQFLRSLDRALGVSRESRPRVRDTETKLGIQLHFGLFRQKRTHEEF